jgi:hypothetical protein
MKQLKLKLKAENGQLKDVNKELQDEKIKKELKNKQQANY